eukprot:gnl/Dysnectes_brevis/1751_a1998_2744.p1 GENE.gnl/Dysnectes_brevis/1751_a1998_2744~~gnl/Dysnectes_brevis/1751_a1998_2744.p1  ORF type:complete len:268 (-),score=86.05 gnl/Dysnectes_brevis/1751_a1998_2744:109-912(-)
MAHYLTGGMDDPYYGDIYDDESEEDQTASLFPPNLHKCLDDCTKYYEDIQNKQSILDDLIRTGSQDVDRLRNILHDLEKKRLPLLETAVDALKRAQADPSLTLGDYEAGQLVVRVEQLSGALEGKRAQLIDLRSQVFTAIGQTQRTQEEDPEMAKQRREQQQRQEMALAQAEEELDDDQEDIEDIHGTMVEITGMLHAMATEVQAQGEVVNHIEETVLEAKDNVDDGVENLVVSERKQKTGGKLQKWMTCLSIIGVIVLVLVVISIL